MGENDSLLEEFVAESKDHLEIMEQGLLTLEKKTEDADPEEIARIFRSIHSIKGAAGFLGLVKVSKLAHVMETLLSRMREGEISPEAIYIDALFAGLDLLSTMVNAVDQSNEIDIEEAHKRLASLVENDQEKPEAASSSRNENVESFSQEDLPDQYENLFAITYDRDTLMQQDVCWPVEQVRELATAGEILAVRFLDMSDDEAAGSSVCCRLLYSTIMEEDVLRAMPNLGAMEIVALDPDQLQEGKLLEEAIVDADITMTSALSSSEERSCDHTHDGSSSATIQNAEQKGQQSSFAQSDPDKTRAKGNHKETADTIRIQVGLLDRLMALAGELVLVRNQHMMAMDFNDPVVRGISQHLDIVTSELQEAIMRTRMQPIGNVFGKLPRIVRDLSHKLDKKIEITSTGDEVEVDKTILEALADPLTHLIRNCCDHGIELPAEREAAGKQTCGRVNVKAFHEAGKINIIIADDGRGIDVEAVKHKALASELKNEEELARMSDKELLSLILLPGFSTAGEVSDVSGRGVGMDVVKTGLEPFGGVLELDSEPGKGTTVKLQLPLTLAIIPCLVVAVDDCRYAIPQVNLEELVCLYNKDVQTRIECAGNQEVFRLRDQLLPLVRFKEVLNRTTPFGEETRNEITESYCSKATAGEQSSSLNFAVVKTGSRRFGLIVDQVLGTEEIVVKPMHPSIKDLSIYSGATVMGDGQVALILDIEGISRHAGMETVNEPQGMTEEKDTNSSTRDENQQVLLFKYGEQEQFAVALPIIKRIEHLKSSSIERVGDKEFVTVDDVSTRILRLDQLMTVSAGEEQEEIFLLLPKYVRRPFGIVINKLLDIAQTPMTMNNDSHMEDGLLGSAIVKDHLTLFPDVYGLIEKAEPDWFDERRAETPPPEEQKRILLLEDMPFFRQMIKGYLEADNYKVLTAEHGLAGLEILANNEVDLIVSDLEMPEMDGWTFIQNVRSNGHGRDLPAMALTALTSEESRERALAAGFDEYEVKINREELLTMTARMLQ